LVEATQHLLSVVVVFVTFRLKTSSPQGLALAAKSTVELMPGLADHSWVMIAAQLACHERMDCLLYPH